MIPALALAATIAPAQATPPSVRNVNVHGLQIGGTTTIAMDGTDLLPNPRLVSTAPIAAQMARPNAMAARVEFDVTLAADVVPGFYNLYVAGDGGISERSTIAIDHLPQRPFAPTVEALPVALHGTLGGSSTLKTMFAAKAGQRITCEVESQRLGAKLRPVLHLYDAENRRVAWSLPSPALRGDTRLSLVAPADGQYSLTLNDLQFAAPAPNYFRLKIGDWQYADVVFPAAVQRGAAATLQLVGNLAPDKLVSLTPTAAVSFLPVPWPAATAASGPAPALFISDVPELLEQTAGDAIQELQPAPSAVNGRLAAAGEQDRYQLKVAPDAKLRFEVFAARFGAPIDSVLEIRRPDGAVLAANDDAPGMTDSLLDFTVPKDVPSLVIAVKDAQGRGGESAVYRLLVTPQPTEPQPADFELVLEQDRYNVPQNGRQVARLRVERRTYQGPIHLDFGPLPAGVAVDSFDIPAGASGKLLTLVGVGETFSPVVCSLRGTAVGLPQPLVRTAHCEPDAVGQFQPWLCDELALALAARGEIGFDAIWQPAAETKLVQGAKLTTAVRSLRPAGYDGPVRLTLLTSQNPPKVNGNDDPNRTLRSESNAPVEIPPDGQAQATWNAKLAADKVLADAQTVQAAAAKAVADAQAAGGAPLDAAKKVKADADLRVNDAILKRAAADEAAQAAAVAAKNEVSYSLLVPADLPSAAVQVAFRAELLSRDRQRVLMTACTPVRTLPVFNPLRVQYGGPLKLSAKLDPQQGASFKLPGKIERLEGFAGDVAVTLTGLPAGVAVPRIVVPAAQSDFELELKFPANAPAGALAGVQLIATGKMTPASPLENRSDPIALAIELMPP